MTEEVLLLDDDATTLTTLDGILTQSGYSCVTAANADDALALIESHPCIAVVLCNVRMQDMTGQQFVSRLNSMTLGRTHPCVLMMTSQPTLEAAVEALRLGVRDLLVKPVRAEELLVAIRRALALLHDSAEQQARPPQLELLLSRSDEDGKLAILNTIEQLRRLRSHYDQHDLDDVAWDLLLELLRAERQQHKLSVSGLAISISGVSATTSLRRMNELVSRGYAERIPDPADARRDFVLLTSKSQALLSDYLAQANAHLSALVS